MQDDLATFLTYYHQKFQGRKLDWDHSLGTATLKARFKAGEKELSVSLYQAVILLLFNDSDSLSYADIKEQTRLGKSGYLTRTCVTLTQGPADDAELQRTLQSLACGKKRVLRKHPLGKDVNKTDTFHFNADFTDPRYQVHINSIQAKETVHCLHVDLSKRGLLTLFPCRLRRRNGRRARSSRTASTRSMRR